MPTPSARRRQAALVTQVVPVPIDLAERGAIDASARLRTPRLAAVGDQQQGLPGGVQLLTSVFQSTGRATTYGKPLSGSADLLLSKRTRVIVMSETKRRGG